MAEMYEERIVAYGDIVGWTEAIKACSTQIDYDRLKKALDDIHQYANNFASHIKERISKAVGPNVPLQEYLVIEFSLFSDSFAVSMPAGFGYKIFDILSNICHPLLRSGFLTRGGITVGSLHHVENIIFGPALIEAHRLEQEAVFPRFLCSSNLLEHLGTFPCPTNYIVTDQLGRQIANLLAFSQQPERHLMTARWDLMGIGRVVENQIGSNSVPGKEKRAEKWRYMRDVLQLMDPRRT